MDKPPFWVLWARWILRAELAQWQLREENALLQIEIVRAMLATTMRQRDNFEAALDHISYELASCKRMRRRERKSARFWITRETKPRISQN